MRPFSSSIFTTQIVTSPFFYSTQTANLDIAIPNISVDFSMPNTEQMELYIAFYVPFSQTENKTKIPCSSIRFIKQGQKSISWRKEDLPTLHFSNSNELAFQFIILAVFHYNPQQRDVLIGQTIVSLKEATTPNPPIIFSNELTKNCEFQKYVKLNGQIHAHLNSQSMCEQCK